MTELSRGGRAAASAGAPHGKGLALTPVVGEDDWRDYHAIRRAVLWEARGRKGYDDRHGDEHRPHHHPLLLRLDGRPIGTVRLDDRRDGTAVVRLVAITADQQRRGHGRGMDALVTDLARRLGAHTLLVNAAPDAVDFYAATGWQPLRLERAGADRHRRGLRADAQGSRLTCRSACQPGLRRAMTRASA